MPGLTKNKRARRIRVGITMGDPSGVGPAIIAKALPKLRGLLEFVVIGDRWVFSQVSGMRYQVPDLKFLDLSNVKRRGFSFGKIRAEYGRAAMEYLDAALGMIKEKQIDCLVTCPISKQAINLAGFRYNGHTEYLAKKSKADNAVMMLLNKNLKFSLVTRHIALKGVSQAITRHKLSEIILITYNGLQKLFGISRPRIVVCGLNPHASDNGIIGREEADVISPAIIKLRCKLKAVICGPLPADSAIYKASLGLYDCVIAMYHDQALIPLKLSGLDSGVNLTLGLPFIRTSPLHGTAFDIAKDFRLINPASLVAAIRISLQCALNQKKD